MVVNKVILLLSSEVAGVQIGTSEQTMQVANFSGRIKETAKLQCLWLKDLLNFAI